MKICGFFYIYFLGWGEGVFKKSDYFFFGGGGGWGGGGVISIHYRAF